MANDFSLRNIFSKENVYHQYTPLPKGKQQLAWSESNDIFAAEVEKPTLWERISSLFIHCCPSSNKSLLSHKKFIFELHKIEILISRERFPTLSAFEMRMKRIQKSLRTLIAMKRKIPLSPASELETQQRLRKLFEEIKKFQNTGIRKFQLGPTRKRKDSDEKRSPLFLQLMHRNRVNRIDVKSRP